MTDAVGPLTDSLVTSTPLLLTSPTIRTIGNGSIGTRYSCPDAPPAPTSEAASASTPATTAHGMTERRKSRLNPSGGCMSEAAAALTATDPMSL